MEDAMANTILAELREFRAENNKRWEENDKRWEENDKRWEENERRWKENEKRWEANEKRWEANEKRWETNDEKLEGMNQRIVALEEGRKTDRNDLLEILDTMQKNITHQFVEMREYFDAKFDKVYASQRITDIEIEKFRKLVYAHDSRLDFYNARIGRLEQWKEEFDMGQLTSI